MKLRRNTTPGLVWIHIDRMDAKDGRIWAVQWVGPRGGCNYYRTRSVAFTQGGYTQSYRRGQPRAYIEVPGRVARPNPKCIFIVPPAPLKPTETVVVIPLANFQGD